MNTFGTTIISGLTLALISGTAYLAIKHYDVYDEIFGKMLVVIFGLYLSIYAYFFGYDSGFDEVSNFIASQNQNIIIPEPKYPIDYSLWLFLSFIAIQIYVFLLDYLGKKIKEKQSQNNK